MKHWLGGFSRIKWGSSLIFSIFIFSRMGYYGTTIFNNYNILWF